jgi:hypothetical protein
MNYKLLGGVAIICAPFLFLDFVTNEQSQNSWLTGLFGFVYMTGWICSIIALKRMDILGTTRWAKIAFTVQLSLLILAQCWNIWVIIGASHGNTLFTLLDMCWPLSNLWMLAIGITALKAKKLRGWKRFVPLFVGLWFPLTVIPAITLGIFVLAAPYSAIAFTLLGLVVYRLDEDEQSEVATVAVA